MNIHGFDARHLAILDMLFTERHVGRAAARLHLSQPAVSNSLAWLRRHFDDPLLVRGGGSLRLTPFAERLRDPVRQLLIDFRAVAMVRPSFEAGEARHHFRITISQYAAGLVMGPLLRRVAEAAPNVTVECRPISGDVNEFERGEIDLLVVPYDVLHGGHGRELLFTDEWRVAACAAQGPDVETLTADGYRDARHVLPDTQQAVGWELEALGVRRAVAAIVPHAQVTEIIVGTPWLATMPAAMLRAASATRIRRAPLPFEIGPLVIGMQWHRDKADEPASLWLRDQMRLAVGEAGLTVTPAVAASLAANDGDQER